MPSPHEFNAFKEAYNNSTHSVLPVSQFIEEQLTNPQIISSTAGKYLEEFCLLLTTGDEFGKVQRKHDVVEKLFSVPVSLKEGESKAVLRMNTREYLRTFESDSSDKVSTAPFNSVGDLLDEIFDIITIEEEAIGTNLLAGVLMQMSLTPKKEFLEPSGVILSFISAYRELSNSESIGFVKTQEIEGNARSKKKSFRPNQSRAMRTALQMKNVLSHEQVFRLERHAVWINYHALNYMDDVIDVLTQNELWELIHTRESPIWRKNETEPYLYLNQLVATMPYNQIKRIAMEGLHADKLSSVNDFLLKNAAYFDTDPEVKSTIISLIENSSPDIARLQSLFDRAVHYIDSEQQSTWAFNQIRTFLNRPEHTGGPHQFQELFNHLTKDQIITLIPDFFNPIDFKDVSWALEEFAQYALSRGFTEMEMELVYSHAFQKSFKARDYLFRYCAKQGGGESPPQDTNAFKQLSPHLQFMIIFKTISYGSHILGDKKIQNLCKIDSAKYTEDTTPYELFVDMVNQMMSIDDIRTLFPKDLILNLETMRKEELGSVEALSALFAYQLEHRFNHDEFTNFRHMSRVLLMELVGFGEDGLTLFDNLQTKRELQDVYLNAIALVNLGIRFDVFPEETRAKFIRIFTPRNRTYSLINVMQDLRSAIELTENKKQLMGKMVQDITDLTKNGEELTPTAIRTYLQQVVSDEFKTVFGLQIEGDIIGKIEQLKKQWGGNIDVLLRAVSRYKGDKEHSDGLLGGLATAIQAELEGQFERHKYTDQVDELEDQIYGVQLTHCTEGQRKSWIYNHHELVVVRDKDPIDEYTIQNLITQAKRFFVDQLTNQRHFGLAFGDKFQLDQTIINGLMQQIAKIPDEKISDVNIKNLLRTYQTETTLKKTDLVAYTVGAIINGIDQNSISDKLITILAKYITNDYHDIDNDLKNDLKVLVQNIDPRKYQKKPEDAVLFTTTTGSLRILLDIGDMVPQSGSCQSLTIGGITHTTLGTAIDAHTKALVTFRIRPHQLDKNPQNAEAIMEYIEKGECTVSFNDSSLLLSLYVGGNTITIPFTYALARRKIIVGKLGNKDHQEARLILEPQYPSGEPQKGLQESFNRVIEMIGIPVAAAGEQLTIRQSKSSKGVWSDLAWGTHKNDYTVTQRF